MKKVMDKVNQFSEDMLVHYASPNRDLISEIMMFDASQLSQLRPDQISQYMLVLGQYLIMLQHNENTKNIEYRLASKALEYRINVERFSRDDIKGKTEKERRAWIIMNNPELQQMDEDLTVSEAEKTIIDNMVRAVEGLLNVLKKEFSSRYSSE